MKTEIVMVTPEMAKSFLEMNTRNRPVNQSQLLLFVEQLTRGEMQLTHQGIAISETGVLLDGQHRLMAIAKTGISAQLLVSTGLPDSVFTVLDSGAKRKARDVLAMDGAKNSSSTASGIRLYLMYTQAPNAVWTGHLPLRLGSMTAIHDEFKRDRASWTLASSLASSYSATGIIAPGPMSCLVYVALRHCHYSSSFVEDFLMRLKIGNDLSLGNPLLAYRTKRFGEGAWSLQQRLADYIKLFNAYSSGLQLKIFKSQAFPPMPKVLAASRSIHGDAAS